MATLPSFLNIWGSNDPGVTKKSALNAMTRGSDYIINGAGHPAYVSHEAEFTKVILKFIDSLKWVKLEA